MVNAEMPLADIYKANLKLSKIAFVNDDRNQTAAQKGENITYIIRVENLTDIEAKNIYAGTETEKNLHTAFAGESQARNKYTFFASIASIGGVQGVGADCHFPRA